MLFAQSDARLDDAAVPVLGRIAEALAADELSIVVSGDTDDRRIRTPRYPSNWELSAARASSVVQVLIAHGLDRV